MAAYRIHYEHPSEKGDVTGFLTIVGDARFLDVMPAEGQDHGSFLTPLHAILRVELSADTLTLTPLSYDWFADLLQSDENPATSSAVFDQRQNVRRCVADAGDAASWLRKRTARERRVGRTGHVCPRVSNRSRLDDDFGVERPMQRVMTIAALLAIASVPCAAQNRSEDEYTRYELLAPETASFKIIYDVTAVTPGAKFFFNPIRKGSAGQRRVGHRPDDRRGR